MENVRKWIDNAKQGTPDARLFGAVTKVNLIGKDRKGFAMDESEGTTLQSESDLMAVYLS
jgi:hypothetical protein